MRFAIVAVGKVVNVAEADEDWVDPTDGHTTVASDTAQIGWAYDGKKFVAPPVPALSTDQLIAVASVYQNKLLAGTWSFDVGTTDAPLRLTTKLDDRGQASMTQLLLWSSLADPSDVEPYSNVDSSSAVITTTQARKLGLMAGQAKASTYTAYNDVVSQIMAVPPTITTAGQVQNYAWPKSA